MRELVPAVNTWFLESPLSLFSDLPKVSTCSERVLRVLALILFDIRVDEHGYATSTIVTKSPCYWYQAHATSNFFLFQSLCFSSPKLSLQNDFSLSCVSWHTTLPSHDGMNS